MAAPAASVRVTPGGIFLPDGYQSFLVVALDTDLSIWEKSGGSLGLDGGEPINITTMHNVLWRTMFLRQLITSTEFNVTGAYDPALLTQLLAVLNVPTTITRVFGDGTTVAFYGGLRNAQFGDLVEGQQPEVTITVTPTNYDHINHVEAGPTVVSAAGT